MSGADPRPYVGRLGALYRYPVKSLVGEPLDRAHVDERGLAGDRLWSVRDTDGKLGSGKSTRRFRTMDGLLALAARYDGEVPVIELPDGRRCRGDDPQVHAALSGHVGREVTLGREAVVSHFDEGPVHLVTSSTLRRLGQLHGAPVDPRRLRPNLVLDTGSGAGFLEDGWVGRRLGIGDEVVLVVRAPMPRCVMVTLAQRELPPDGALLQSATAANDANVGVVADVLLGGEVALGDQARLLD